MASLGDADFTARMEALGFWGRQKKLPASSEEYKKCSEYTKLQGKSVGVKGLVPGHTYLTKKQEPRLYLGRFDYHYLSHRGEYAPKAEKKGREQTFVFWDPEGKGDKGDFVYLADPKNIAALQSDVIAPDFAALVGKYNKSVHGSPAVRLFLKDVPDKDPSDYNRHTDYWYEEESPGVFAEYETQRSWSDDRGKPGNIYAIVRRQTVSIDDGVLVAERSNGVHYTDGRRATTYRGGNVELLIPFKQPTTKRLFVEHASGAKRRFYAHEFSRR